MYRHSFSGFKEESCDDAPPQLDLVTKYSIFGVPLLVVMESGGVKGAVSEGIEKFVSSPYHYFVRQKMACIEGKWLCE